MNKTRYRIVFNKARGMLMAVAEHVASAGKSVQASDASASGRASPANNTTVTLKPTHFAVLYHLGLVSFVSLVSLVSFSGFANLAHADIMADQSAPANQRPVIINAPNGVPLVNIQTPSAAGVSRNTYSQFNVNANGAILNNSRTNVQTQLGGWVQGNPYLATGTARIILNEVNSHNPSLLNGYVEVAGSRAQVVIANPAGISCNGCGFINASRTTLTTGTPIINNGDLMGYRVGGGVINFLGTGLDTANSNYTDVIARAVNINAGLWAQDLNIVTGSNQVNVASNGDITGITQISPNATLPDGSSNPTPGFAIDVAALGGMYAGKIHMVGTEAGLGVRNAGEIGASVGEFTLTTDGQLINTGKISATTQNSINVQSISNTEGSITAAQNLTIHATSLTGDGSLLSGGNATVTLSTDYTQTSAGELQANGNLTFTTTGNLTNQGSILAGGTLSLNAANIDNTTTAEITGLNTHINAANTLTNRGLIDGRDTFITAGALNNIGTGSVFGDHLAIAANTLNNTDETVNSINTAAVIAARNRLDIGALTINNQNNALMFSAGEMAIGGALDVNHQAVGTATTVNNVSASIEALGDLDMSATTLTNKKRVFSMVRQVTGTSTRNYQECVDPPDCDYIYHNTSTDTVYQDVVTADSPIATILAGGNAHLTIGDTINEYSTIAAGLNLNLVGSSLLNQGAELYQQTDTLLTKVLIHWGDRYHGTWTYPSSISLLTSTAPAVISAGEALTGSFTDRIDNVSIREHSPIGTLSSPDTTQSTVSALPQSSLFQTAPSATVGYFIETNPRFASYRNWLSSDYMLNALALDPALTQKRLGDGFYEQKLIREQIAQLTGRRFLTGYASDEAQYQALMMNGVTFAQAHQLVPGVALSAAQIAQLTSDIVWLVEQTVTLPDGSQSQALVPQVYARLQAGDLNNSGALLAGNHINLNLDGELNNNSIIAGRQVVNLSADNINNLGGRMQAGNQLILDATHDINMVGTTSDVNMQQNTGYGTSTAQLTQVNRVAGLYVTNPNGVLVASAGHDINLKAAEIKNGGVNGVTVIDAGGDLNLGTLTETSDTFGQGASGGRKGYRRENISQDVGTVIQTDGDLTLNAGNNLTARAANVTSDSGTLTASATNDVNIEAGMSTYNMEAYRKSKSSGTLSSKSSVHRDTVNSTDVISSTFSGNNVNIAAGNNLSVKASNIVGTKDVNLDAGNNVTLTTEQATHDETHYSKTKKSGFTASSTSIGYGSSKLTNTNDSQQVTNVGSTVGSVEGDVNINSGNPSTGSGRGTYTQTGSDVLTPQGDINITAQQVNITNATDTYANQQTMKYKQTGITLAITSPVISAIQTAQQMSKAASQTSDGRMKALAAGTVALSAMNAADALGRVDEFGNVPTADNTGPDDMTNVREANAAEQVGGINVSLSIGTSKSSSKTTQTNSTAKSSNLNAGGDVNISATGAGTNSDINVIGSTIKAANDVTLKAEDQINLQAAQNVDTLNGKSKGSSASLGVSFGTDGFLVTAGLSGSKGKTKGNGTTWTETQIQSGNPSTIRQAHGAGRVGRFKCERCTSERQSSHCQCRRQPQYPKPTRHRPIQRQTTKHRWQYLGGLWQNGWQF
ncbi:MAG: hemagglutinin repeat-containing protein [Methylotenera sp.]|nr:hemagglutinin repeat-containing protein [Methylotenera sp.]